jgi:hypothetical protein
MWANALFLPVPDSIFGPKLGARFGTIHVFLRTMEPWNVTVICVTTTGSLVAVQFGQILQGHTSAARGSRCPGKRMRPYSLTGCNTLGCCFHAQISEDADLGKARRHEERVMCLRHFQMCQCRPCRDLGHIQPSDEATLAAANAVSTGLDLRVGVWR